MQTAVLESVDPRRLPVRRFSAAEYLRLADDGYFRDQRVELLEGVIFEMSPQKSPHFTFISRINTELVLALGRRYAVRVQLPLFSSDDSVPEPDVCVMERSTEDDELPRPHSARLIIEVADSSEPYDSSVKVRIYARAGVPEYCIADVRKRTFTVLTGPQPKLGTYRTRHVLKATEVYQSKTLAAVKLRLRELFV